MTVMVNTRHSDVEVEVKPFPLIQNYTTVQIDGEDLRWRRGS